MKKILLPIAGAIVLAAAFIFLAPRATASFVVGGGGGSSSSSVAAAGAILGANNGTDFISTSTTLANLGGISAVTSNTLPNPLTVNADFLAYTITGYYQFPSPTQLAFGTKCGGTSNVKEVGACVGDILSWVASGTQVTVGPYLYPSSTWTSAWQITTNQKFITFSCVPNVSTFIWGGAGTSTFWNYGSSASAPGYTAHTYNVGVTNCSFYNGGSSNNSTSTFAAIGGTNGAEGFFASGNRFQGWGQVFVTSNNVFLISIDGNQAIDNGQFFYNPPGLSNTGERYNITNNIASDDDALTGGLRSSSSVERYIDVYNLVGFNIAFNSIDDAGTTIETGSSGNYIGNYQENPAVASNPNFPAYHYLTVASGASANVTDWTIMQDASSSEATSTSNAFGALGGTVNANGVIAISNIGVNNITTTQYLFTETGPNAQLQSSGIVNSTSGPSAFTRVDPFAPTSTSGLQAPWSQMGNTAATFTFASGTVTGDVNYLTGDEYGILYIGNGGGNARSFGFAVPFWSNPTCIYTGASSTAGLILVRAQPTLTTTTGSFYDSTAIVTSSAVAFDCKGNIN